MGRTPTKNLNLPTGIRVRKRRYGTYYYFDAGIINGKRKEVPLGADYVDAIRKWAELTKSGTKASQLITFRHVAERYMREVLPTKSPATQAVNLRELKSLYEFFKDEKDASACLDDIDPMHVRQFLDWRGKTAKVRANREKALFSHIWNFARGKGLTSKANPCAGIKGYVETGRDTYIDDAVFKAVHDAAEVPLRDAMDLAYLTGQRPADVLKLTLADIKDGAIWIRQNKTGAKLRITVEGELADLIKRIKGRKVMGKGLVNMMDGTPMSKFALRGAMDRARTAAAGNRPDLADAIKQFQFRDLRAKAATDKEESQGIVAAQDQLGHSTSAMTKHYVRHRRGKLVTPTK